MERLSLFRKALSACEPLRKTHPDPSVVDSVIAQIKYLISVETGESKDRSRIPNLTLGFLAARDIGEIDKAVAKLLNDVSDEARRM